MCTLKPRSRFLHCVVAHSIAAPGDEHDRLQPQWPGSDIATVASARRMRAAATCRAANSTRVGLICQTAAPRATMRPVMGRCSLCSTERSAGVNVPARARSTIGTACPASSRSTSTKYQDVRSAFADPAMDIATAVATGAQDVSRPDAARARRQARWRVRQRLQQQDTAGRQSQLRARWSTTPTASTQQAADLRVLGQPSSGPPATPTLQSRPGSSRRQGRAPQSTRREHACADRDPVEPDAPADGDGRGPMHLRPYIQDHRRILACCRQARHVPLGLEPVTQDATPNGDLRPNRRPARRRAAESRRRLAARRTARTIRGPRQPSVQRAVRWYIRSTAWTPSRTMGSPPPNRGQSPRAPTGSGPARRGRLPRALTRRSTRVIATIRLSCRRRGGCRGRRDQPPLPCRHARDPVPPS